MDQYGKRWAHKEFRLPPFQFCLTRRPFGWVLQFYWWGMGELMEFSTHWQVFCKAGGTAVKNRGSGLRLT